MSNSSSNSSLRRSAARNDASRDSLAGVRLGDLEQVRARCRRRRRRSPGAPAPANVCLCRRRDPAPARRRWRPTSPWPGRLQPQFGRPTVAWWSPPAGTPSGTSPMESRLRSPAPLLRNISEEDRAVPVDYSRPRGDTYRERPELVAEEIERHRDRDRDRLRGQVAHRRTGDQRFEQRQVDQQRGDADGEEAGRLEAGVAVDPRRRSSAGSRGSCW